mgnify:CR=1 FL=1
MQDMLQRDSAEDKTKILQLITIFIQINNSNGEMIYPN